MTNIKAPKNLPVKIQPKFFIIAAVVVGLLVVGGIVGARKYYDANLKGVSSSQTSVNITIPTGSSLGQIADILHQKGVIRNAWAFKQYVLARGLGSSIQAGTYAIKPSQNVPEIVDILTEGRVASKLVTIKPSKRLDQIEQNLINSGFDPAAVKKALDPDVYAGHPALVDKPDDASLEGYLYPESFQKTSSTTPKQIVRASLDEMQKRLTPDLRDAFSRRGLSVHRAIILASMVEREVATDSDRQKVAQVFLKRLNSNMKLQSDVTAFYGAIINGQNPSVRYDSPYNTYLHDGLPAGPISNVSESSLEAVAHPALTDWLYFVAGDDGKTYFSKTVEEHEALVKAHCHKLCGN